MRIGYFNIIKIDHEYAIQLYIIKVRDFDSKTIKYYECYSKSSLIIYRIFVETNILTETNKYIFVDKL